MNNNGPLEKTRAAGTSRDFEPVGKEPMDYNVQEPTTTPKLSQRQLRTERVEIEFETDMDSEPSGQVHRGCEGRGSRWHDSPSTHYKHNVRVFNYTHRF